MRVRIQHLTHYSYDKPVALGAHLVRLFPAQHLASHVLTYNLSVSPDAALRWQTDAWGNRVCRLDFAEKSSASAEELTIQVDASFELVPVNPFDFFIDEEYEEFPFSYDPATTREFAPYLRTENIEAEVHSWLEQSEPTGNVINYLVALNQRVADEVDYIIRLEPGIQTPAETLRNGRGSCRDSASLLCHALRARGFIARFVSGYLIQLEDEGNIPGEPRGMDEDVLDLHAWAEVFIPGAGWIGLDGTSGLLCTEGHIPLCATTEPALAAPIDGGYSYLGDGQVHSTLDYEMHVERIGHQPRPRKPYTDAQYENLLKAGDDIDARLEAANVTLTTGGEPTWTSRDYPNRDEWTTDALGPTKQRQARVFADEIRRRLSPNAVLLQSYGKRYPGESLPRWNLRLLSRRDGKAIWSDPALLRAPTEPAEEFASDSGEKNHEERLDAANTVAEKLTEALGFPSAGDTMFKAWEDPWPHLITEANLPPDVNAEQFDLGDTEERARLVRTLNRGLDKPAGYVIPVQLQQARWRPASWKFRREKLVLIPGDSAMGYRLPLDRLPGDEEVSGGFDPFSATGPLSEPEKELRRQHPTQAAQDTESSQPYSVPSTGTPGSAGSSRRAICVEPRGDEVYVFLPPADDTDAWLELVTATEQAARDADIPIVLEGYGPPSDPRLTSIDITPDPGVLEVNIPYATSTRGYAETLEQLAEAATHAGLCTERFQLDGRSVGSGGGNHITLGGPHPSQSVFLQRPQVLASLLRFTNNHPSLSYFFSGMFVGPTCQAPRVDEGRAEFIDELELALSQIHRGGDPPPNWFVDRLLRNLLADASGNTHRAEVCIDKLFNPGSPSGRLGIVEMRAFEMPPNERMATAQAFLLRALITAFVEQPYQAPLRRWGHRLHDRFMLPSVLWHDLMKVLDFLELRGITCDSEWFEPFFEYRFPVIGRLETDGVSMTVRPALEPWPVLGEEPTGATTTRFVDSSMERVEVAVRGLDEERHVVSVNGIALPLHQTANNEERIAGIRFRAWQPPHCLHPHIGIHHPLNLDIVDTWQRRSIGGAAYHVWHPDGRAFEEPPLTAFEAASRRNSRFVLNRHMPWPAEVERPSRKAARGVTLDLRWTGTDVPVPYFDPDASIED